MRTIELKESSGERNCTTCKHQDASERECAYNCPYSRCILDDCIAFGYKDRFCPDVSEETICRYYDTDND